MINVPVEHIPHRKRISNYFLFSDSTILQNISNIHFICTRNLCQPMVLLPCPQLRWQVVLDPCLGDISTATRVCFWWSNIRLDTSNLFGFCTMFRVVLKEAVFYLFGQMWVTITRWICKCCSLLPTWCWSATKQGGERDLFFLLPHYYSRKEKANLEFYSCQF